MSLLQNILDQAEECYCEILEQCASDPICIIEDGVRHDACAYKGFHESIIQEAADGCKIEIQRQEWIIPCKYVEELELEKCDEICWTNKQGNEEIYEIVPYDDFQFKQQFGAYNHCIRITSQLCREVEV